MSNQILISSGAKLRDLDDVIIGTDGVLTSLGFNVANGVPKLDENGKILVSQLPNSVMEFKGVWSAATNTPTLVDGTGNAGDVYLCNVAGTVNFGTGPITFAVGDYVVYTGSVWARSSGATGTVTSVGVSRSGDALAVTGSPITTSGTINLGFAGTNLQYINGAGNLVTFPTLLSSVGLSMPSAFTVSNSPLTANGTIAVTGAGTTAQYVRGDGSLANFPTIAAEAQRLITEVYNETGATLAKGSIVYINGGHGNLPTVTKAIATGDSTSAQTYGIVQNDIGNNNNGFVVVLGSLTDLDTQAYADGTQLYLSGTTAGAWTSIKPYAPIHLVYVGIVTRSHPTQGIVEVRIQNGYEMDELHNVSAQNPNNNDILQYKTSTSLWTKVAGTTSNIAEGSNLYYTDARSRSAISLTTIGSTGAATYNSSTGVLNIPNYVDQFVGTVTSVGLSAPTGFSVSGSPVTSSGTLALAFASGYSLPTNVKQSNWDDAYTWVAAFPTQTGNAGKFLTTDGSILSWATVIAGVQSVTASSPLFSSGGANPNITIQVATTSQNGYLSSTDWNTFNGKQNALTNPVTGTGTLYQIPYFSSTGSTITGSSNIVTNVNGGLTFGAANSSTNNYFTLNHKDGVDGGILLHRDITTTDWQIINASTSGNLDFYSYGINANILSLNKSTGTATFRNSIVIGTNPASVSAGLAIGLPNDNAIRWRNAANTGNLGLYLSGSNKFVFDEGIAANGTSTFSTNVTLLSGTLQVNGTSSSKANIYADYSGGNVGISLFNTAGTENIVLNSANGGIYGTTMVLYDNTNSALLKLRRDAGQQRGALQFGRSNGDTAQIVGDSDSTSLNNGVMSFWTTNGSGTLVDYMWLKGGNLLVGTSTNAGYKLDVNGTGRFQGTITYSGTSNVLTAANGNTGYLYQYFANTGASFYLGLERSTGQGLMTGSSAYATILTTNNATNLEFGTNGVKRITVNGTSGITTFNSNIYTLGQLHVPNNSTGTLGGIYFDYNANVASRTWQIVSDYDFYGDFQIRQSTTQTGSTYAKILGFSPTGAATFSSTVTIGAAVSGGGALQVNGNVNINGVFQINGVTIGGGGGSGVTGSGTTNYLTKWTGSTTLGNGQIFDNGSNVIIGSTSATNDSKFEIKGNGIWQGAVMTLTNTGAGGKSISLFSTNTSFGQGAGRLLIYNGTDNVDMLNLTSGGNLLLGTNTDNGYKLNLNGSISYAYGFLSIYRGSSSPNDILVGNDGSRFYIGGNTYVAGSITATGSISASSGFFDTSDARLKNLVEDNYLLSSIANVKAKLYIKDGRKELGYYAQDLLEILPSAVKEGADGFLSLSYAQVHTAKIAVIEDKVTILENEVAELKNKLQKYEA